MTAINRFRNRLIGVLLLPVLCASGLSAEVRFFNLKKPQQPLTNPSISQGGALALTVPEGSKVWWNGESVFVDTQGMALVAVHRDGDSANLKVILPSGEQSLMSLPVDKRNYRIERVDGLPPAKVTAPKNPELQKRIRKESAEIRQARKLMDDREDYLKGFIWPVKGRISGRYGSQRILNGTPKTPHYGVDVAVLKGTKVVAPADGVIIYANSDMYYSGGTLVIDHGHGLSSAFLHLSELLVPEGTRVKQGQVVAKVGATGRATGPHLDWRMNWGKVRVDPQLLVVPMKQALSKKH